jgi:beta-glucanase (GH16 family)
MSLRIILGAALAALVLSVAVAQADPPAVGNTTQQWKQTFADEFSSATINPLQWTTCYWWATGTGCTNPGNNELEYYQPGNVIESGGTLTLRAKAQQIVTPAGKSFAYTSGMVSTDRSPLPGALPHYAFTYGYAEARVKLPKGKGLWPAFWMLPTDHTWPPELDVFENIGSNPTSVSMGTHYLDASGVGQNYARQYIGPDFSAGWHTIGLDWQPGMLVWYVDGVVRHYTTDPQMIPSKAMYLIANLAVGGDWPGSPDSTTTFPADFQLDYIRVWQRVAATTTTATATTAAKTRAKR